MEPRFPIRFVALDIDGTLVAGPYERGVPERTAATVRRVLEAGVVVALVTGRMAAGARPLMAELSITTPLIAHHGAVIRDSAGRLLVHARLDAAVARDVLAWAAARGLPAHFNHLDRLIMRADDRRAAAYGRLLDVRPVLVPDLADALRGPITKVMIGGEPLAPDVLATAREDFAGRATVTTSSPRFVEFLSPEASKGRAVDWLARRAGVPLEQVLAIGDNWSDLDMLVVVGHPVAMPHAPGPVLAVARIIAPPLAEAGAAQVLEALVLGRASGAKEQVQASGAAQ